MKRALLLCFLAGCSTAALPVSTACTVDGARGDTCYAAVTGGGAILGVAVLRDVEGVYFQATTISRGRSTFPAPNNDVSYATADGVVHTCTGSATWDDDGARFCVRITAACTSTTTEMHIACVPSSMLNKD